MLAFLTHGDCQLHETPRGHPDSMDRLGSLNEHLRQSGVFDDIHCFDARLADIQDLTLVHNEGYVESMCNAVPMQGLFRVDADTSMGPNSLNATRRSVGALLDAVDMVLDERFRRVFCAVRPPGHHAESALGMGFCLFNTVAIAVTKALQTVAKIAILDFDVHHGNGTVEIFKNNPQVLVCSSFQYPYYPYRYQEVVAPNIVNTPLPAGTSGQAFRLALENDWIPAFEKHQPELIFVSAGFDGHRDDPMGQFELEVSDFTWVTELICSLANRYTQGRIISALEGGYDLKALASSVETHLHGLMTN